MTRRRHYKVSNRSRDPVPNSVAPTDPFCVGVRGSFWGLLGDAYPTGVRDSGPFEQKIRIIGGERMYTVLIWQVLKGLYFKTIGPK